MWEYTPDGMPVHPRAQWTHTVTHSFMPRGNLANQATNQHVVGTFNMQRTQCKPTRTQEVHVLYNFTQRVTRAQDQAKDTGVERIELYKLLQICHI